MTAVVLMKGNFIDWRFDWSLFVAQHVLLQHGCLYFMFLESHNTLISLSRTSRMFVVIVFKVSNQRMSRWLVLMLDVGVSVVPIRCLSDVIQ